MDNEAAHNPQKNPFGTLTDGLAQDIDKFHV